MGLAHRQGSKPAIFWRSGTSWLSAIWEYGSRRARSSEVAVMIEDGDGA